NGLFDEVFRSEGIRVVKTPVRAPKANAIAERFVRTVRSECLDWLLILNRRHLERVLRLYVAHYNRERPHRALELAPPLTDARSRDTRRLRFAVAIASAASSTSTTGRLLERTPIMAPFKRAWMSAITGRGSLFAVRTRRASSSKRNCSGPASSTMPFTGLL